MLRTTPKVRLKALYYEEPTPDRPGLIFDSTELLYPQNYEPSAINTGHKVYVPDRLDIDYRPSWTYSDASDERRASTDSIGKPHRRPSIQVLGDKVVSASKQVGHTVKSAAGEELKYEILRFGHTTSAHGIPRVLNAHTCPARTAWVAVNVSFFIIFLFQCNLVWDKFQRKEKIVNVELQFESAPFPAVTICNLNPFKKHLARRVPEISETLDAFHQAVTYSKDAAQHYNLALISRSKRSNEYGNTFRWTQYEPIWSDCDCSLKSQDNECIQKDGVPKDPSNRTLCMCNYDRQDSTAWPCYHASTWIESICPECNDIGYCNLPETNGTSRIPCYCQKNVRYCLLKPERLKQIWAIRGKEIPDPESPFRQDYLQQLKELGYENMTDEVAIATKTKEKLILTMAGLPVHRRIALSYGKGELIKMCSFNGQQCDIRNDFKLHVDPAFGNCFTFNANRHNRLNSSRAGPSYGLRLMIQINASDYLPTTEATGVRIAIHDPDEWPFPDTFGYSAPTGSLSSFGLALRKVHRLSEPYGDCVQPDEPLPRGYIYQNYKYEPEGCYKSCYQETIIQKCKCSDPRYPTSRNNTPQCNSLDPLSRNCLIVEGIKFTRKHNCTCKHPCVQNVYTTTYSSAKLAAGAFRSGTCAADSSEPCLNYDSENSAMLEIYYEQMSYETLTESESYLVVNLISDIGGQAGLWLGASILTMVEIFVFILRLLTLKCRAQFTKSHKRRKSSQYVVNTVKNSYVGDLSQEHAKKTPQDTPSPTKKSNITVPDIKVINDYEEAPNVGKSRARELPDDTTDLTDTENDTSRQNQTNSLSFSSL